MLILCNIHLRYIIPWYAQLSFWIKESDHDVKLNWKDIIDIHLWNNKDNHPEECVMYKLKNMWFIFVQIESILFARERSIFYFLFYFVCFFWGGEGGRLLHLPLARVPMYEAVLIFNYNM